MIKLVDDGALTDLGALGLVDTLQTLERVRNKLPVLDRAMIAYGTEQGVPAALSETDHAPCPHHRTPPLGQGSVPPRQSRRTSPTWSAGTTTTDSPNAAGKYRINTDGLPVWIPPTWADRQQRPILNTRITINTGNPANRWTSNNPSSTTHSIPHHHPTDQDHPLGSPVHDHRKPISDRRRPCLRRLLPCDEAPRTGGVAPTDPRLIQPNAVLMLTRRSS